MKRKNETEPCEACHRDTPLSEMDEDLLCPTCKSMNRKHISHMSRRVAGTGKRVGLLNLTR